MKYRNNKVNNKRTYTSETFISKNGTTITVNIPVRTMEEQAIRDREIEESLRAIYLKLESEGKAWIFKK